MTDDRRIVALSVVAAAALAFAGSWFAVVDHDRDAALAVSAAERPPAPGLRRAPARRRGAVVRRSRAS
ncbi:MAG: hypothetical protein R3F59_14700 [Myxococcota bacterium]